MNERTQQPKVFLSYAAGDKEAATRIAYALIDRGLNIWFDLGTPAGATFDSSIFEAISASDYLVVLLSPNSVKSKWVEYELKAAMDKQLAARDITILPVLIADTEIPPLLQKYQYLDCRKDVELGVERLVDQISAAPEIDFSKLTWEQFEDLVMDLLAKLNFRNIEKQPFLKDLRFDIKADYPREDPFGVPKTETWLVECKFYKKSRADVKAISEFLFALGVLAANYRGLLITNSHLTSAAQDHLAHLETKVGKDVRVVDGTELKRLLIKYRDLVDKYFLTDEGTGNEPSE